MDDAGSVVGGLSGTIGTLIAARAMGSSIADIERATGLNASSLYNTFGSKEALFHRALARYEGARLRTIVDLLATGAGGLDDVHRALELQQAECDSEWGVQGCLAINAMIELGPRAADAKEQLADYRSRLGDAIRMPLDRAVALGEISATRVPSAVALLLSLTLAVGVLMRSGATHAELARHFEAAHAAVESWRL